MRGRTLVLSLALFLFLFQSLPSFAADSSTSSSSTNSSTTNYDDINFPQWSKDLRRTEIITLGSVPFVTLWTTLGYSVAVYGEFRNPMSTNTDDFTESDKKKIIAMTGGICLGLGLFDLAFNLVKRASNRRNTHDERAALTVVPKSAEGDQFNDDKKSPPDKRPDRGDRAYLIEGVVQNAIF